MSEDVVLLDEQGVAVGSARRTTVHHEHTPLHLAFSCYLVNTTGHVLLTQRARHKMTWPGVWTNSCCGHPKPGEAIVDAVVRRLDDELGISVEQIDLILPEFRYRAVMENGMVENEMCPVFRAWAAGDVSPNHREVAEVRWLTWQDLTATIADGTATTSPWFRTQVADLERLGRDPRHWATGREADLPSAARDPRVPPR